MLFASSVLFALLACKDKVSSSPEVEEPSDLLLPTSPPVITPAPTQETTQVTSEPEPFVPTFSTEYAGDVIAIRSNLPGGVSECAAILGAPCDDYDLDGLVDLWEDEILARVRPKLQFDESEPLIDDLDAVLAIVGRVALVGDQLHVYMMIGYHYDYGRCGLSSHDGDSERVVVALQRLTGAGDGPGDVSIVAAYTAAHEGTLIDAGEVYEGAALGELSFPLDPGTGEPRWLVWPSDGKHATYASIDACESSSLLPCVEEDCAPDGVDPLPFEILPEVTNAGEEQAPRLSDLSAIGFPDEDAWLEQDFCGGRGRGPFCSAPVRDKLLVDPF